MPTVRIIGPGRAGRSLAAALRARGWAVDGLLGRSDDLRRAASGVDALVIATPDGVVAPTAAIVEPEPSTVVLHLSGSLGLEALDGHLRRAALHPLVPLPTPEIGARRLAGGITFAVAGDPLAARMAQDLGGRVVSVDDRHRVAYHAAACVAANHVVALLGQVERLAAGVGLDLEAFVPLAAAAVDDVRRLGPAGALTGPARRGDWETLDRHLDALPENERDAYSAGVALALRLARDAGDAGDAERDRSRGDRPSAPEVVGALGAAPFAAG